MPDKEMQFKETEPLKWPDGFGRTLIDDRRSQGGWKKPYATYVKGVVDELRRFGASVVQITKNSREDERYDPGVAVWFSINRTGDSSWQKGLEIDNPKPTIEEIDRQFKRLAAKHHPEAVANGSGGDTKMFLKYGDWKRQARAWVRGESIYSLDECLPCDVFTEQRQNMAAIKLTLTHLRGLERLGNPFIVERIMERSFRAALPANASTEVRDGAVA